MCEECGTAPATVRVQFLQDGTGLVEDVCPACLIVLIEDYGVAIEDVGPLDPETA